MLISQDCEEGLRDAASSRFVHGVVGQHACLSAGGDRSSRSAQIMPLSQMVRHRILVPIIAGSNPAGAVRLTARSGVNRTFDKAARRQFAANRSAKKPNNPPG